MKVLIIGDPPGSPGGIAQVMSLLGRWSVTDTTVKTLFLNPLGKSANSKYPNLTHLVKTLYVMMTNRPSVVHLNTASHGSTYRNMIIGAISYALRIPYVIHLHGGGYPKFVGLASKTRRRMICRFFQSSITVIALTPWWGDFLADKLGVQKSRISIIPNGTADPEGIETGKRAKTPSPTFVYAGRLTTPKGVPELIEAFQKLPGCLDAHLSLIGDDMDSNVRASLSDSKANITLLGRRSNTETLDYMAKAWAVVLPSHFENMPLTILEAMSVETAVIATKVGGIPEVVKENCEGVLLPPGDVDALVLSMIRLCELDTSVSLGMNGRQTWSANYTTKRMCLSIMKVWRDAS